MTEFNYKAPGKVVKEFLKDDSFFRGLRGPVGSGKSVSFKYVTNSTDASHSIQGIVITYGTGDLR